MFDVHNLFLGVLLKFAWLLGARVDEKVGGGGMFILSSSPKRNQLYKRSKEKEGPGKQFSLS